MTLLLHFLSRRVRNVWRKHSKTNHSLTHSFIEQSGTVMFLSMQTNKLCNAITCALSTIESYIREQVVSAIGKEVQPSDFAEYMDYHYSRLFREAYRPQPFCFSIRRPNRFPQGSISIESFSNSSCEPIRTSVMKAPSGTQRACLSHPVTRIRLLQQQLTLRHRYHVISLECCHECTF